MKLGENLNAACFSLAKCAKWERRPVDLVSIEDLANRFADIARDYIDYLEGQDRDPNIVVRAIRYIEHHHGQPYGDGVDWFHCTLGTLVELVCPNTQPDPGSEAFYRDIEEGVRNARAEYAPSLAGPGS